MKIKVTVFVLTLLTVSSVHISAVLAQYAEYMQWGLPEGAKARLGKGTLSKITYSPDGKLLAVAGSAGTWIYDAKNLEGQSLLRVWDGVFDSNSLTIIGKNFEATGSAYGPNLVAEICFYDVAMGVKKGSIEIGSTVGPFAYSSVSNQLATGNSTAPKNVVMWDTETKTQMYTLSGHQNNLKALAFSPDGETLATASYESIRLWDVTKGRGGRLIAVFDNDSYEVKLAFSPDGTMLAGGIGYDVKVWDVRTTQLKAVTTNFGYIYDLAFSPDGTMLASSKGILWETETWERKAILLSGYYDSSYYDYRGTAVAYSPDGKTLAIGFNKHALQLWDVAKISSQIREHDYENDFDLSLNWNYYWDSYEFKEHGIELEGDPILIDKPDGVFYSFDPGGVAGIYSLAYLTDGNTLLINEYLLWDTTTGSRKGTLSGADEYPVLSELVSGPLSLNSASVEKLNWVVSRNLNIEIIRNLTSGVVTSLTNPARALAYSPNGSILAIARHTEAGGVLQLWDPVTRRLIRTIEVERTIGALAFSPDGTILTSGHGSTVNLWNTGTGEHLRTISGTAPLVYSPDGRTLAIGREHVAFLCDTEKLLYNLDYLQIERILNGHTGRVTDLVYSPDGTTLASASRDGTILIWQIEPSPSSLLPEDVNMDGVVNILDMVRVASNFGKKGPNTADINGDGVVNILDLTLVAAKFGNMSSAPATWNLNLATTLTRADVAAWLHEARQMNLTEPVFQRGILVLEQLLAALTPTETTLLPNYPNPFNPETWIPYQLSESVDVVLTIYSVDGKLVRRLDLGHKAAGFYQSRSRAAHWDGRNNVNERVASGIYFYTLTAGDFSATRKMLIMK